MPVPFVTAVEAETMRPICDGKWLDLNTFRADDGIRELMFKVMDLDPVGVAKAEGWNKVGSPEASELFEPIDEKMVA